VFGLETGRTIKICRLFEYTNTYRINPFGRPEFTPGFSGVRVARSLVVCVVFSRSVFVPFPFSFVHCVVCLSSIYRLCLPLWYLQTLLIIYISVSNSLCFSTQGWLIKRTVQNEPFVTKFPFILTNLGIWKSCRYVFINIRYVFVYSNSLHIFMVRPVSKPNTPHKINMS
jgi:hypothetical protein